MIAAFSAFVKRNPIKMGAMTLGTRYSLGDIFTQTVIEGADWKSYDLRRTATFATFGTIMGGGPLYWWFAKFLPSSFTKMGYYPAVATRCFTDVWTLMPYFYFPIFYQVKEVVNWNGQFPFSDIPRRALKKYYAGFKSDVNSTMQVCIPMNIILFTLAKDHFRVPLMSVLGMVWVLTLSSRRGKVESEDETDSDS